MLYKKVTLESQMSVHLSVILSVSDKNPSASQNHNYQPSTNKQINHQSHGLSYPSEIMPIFHHSYWPSYFSTIMPISHHAYQQSCLSAMCDHCDDSTDRTESRDAIASKNCQAKVLVHIISALNKRTRTDTQYR